MGLRRIQPEQVEIGMYIQGFDGSWFNHPFWRSRFVIEKQRDLIKVRESAVRAVIVDDDRSRPMIARPLLALPPVQSRIVPAAPGNAVKPRNFAQDYSQALKIFGRSKRAVSAMYSDVRLGKVVKAEKLAPLVDEITDSIDQNPRAFISIAQLKNRHEYTYMHSVAVCALMINLARELRFGEAAVREAGMAGLLHDIGKALMPPEILEKPGPLTDEEYAIMQTHPLQGRDLLARSSGVSHNALDVCLRHHEKFDGTGYPDGLAGDRLSLFARMSALCDVYDAVTSNRAYKRPWTPTEAVETMRGWTGHFDPEMFEVFVRSVGIYPVGAIVRLKSGRIGIVIGENPEDPTRPPMVSPPIEGEQAERIDTTDDEIVAMEDAEDLKIESWESKRTQLIRRFRS